MLAMESSLLVLLLAASSARASIIVVNGAPIQSLQTAVFKFYGPQRENVQGSAIFLRGDEYCDPDPAIVAGKIVVYTGIPLASFCLPTRDIYPKLNSAGALALVWVHFVPTPGCLTFYHSTWDPHVHSGSPMTFVSMSSGAVLDMDLWRNSQNLTLQITSGHSTAYEELFTSLTWTLIMRVLVPVAGLCAFYQAVKVGKEVYNTNPEANRNQSAVRKELRVMTLVICLIEGFVSFFIGFVHVVGHSGPTMLPIQVHHSVFNSLTGSGLFCNLLEAVAMREEVRHFTMGLPRRPVLSTYWKVICLGAFVLIGSDIVTAIFMATEYLNIVANKTGVTSDVFLAALVIIYVFQGALVGSYFMRNAYSLGAPLLVYARSRSKAGLPNSPESLYIGRLAMRWVMVGIVMLVGFGYALFFLFMLIEHDHLTLNTYFFVYFDIGMVRLALAYLHIKLIRKKSFTVEHVSWIAPLKRILCPCWEPRSMKTLPSSQGSKVPAPRRVPMSLQMIRESRSEDSMVSVEISLSKNLSLGEALDF